MTIQQIQCLLQYLGYYTMTVDGISGPGTEAADRGFQAAAALEVDGIAGTATQSALREAVYWDEVADSTTESAEVTTTGGDWWGDIQYFTQSEFACKCGGKYCDGYPAEPSEKLVRIADEMRKSFGRPVTVSSGLRCTTHNANVGGVSNSRHLSGKAMDFAISGCTAAQILAWTQARSDLRYSYAINDSYVHMDVE